MHYVLGTWIILEVSHVYLKLGYSGRMIYALLT